MRLFTAFILVILITVACDTAPKVTQSSPEEAVKGLFEALKASDFEKAELYGTSSTQESLRNFATNLKMINEDEKSALMAPFKMEVSKVTCSEVDGTTTCQVCCSTEGDIAIEVVQQDDKWFAQMEFAF